MLERLQLWQELKRIFGKKNTRTFKKTQTRNNNNKKNETISVKFEIYT